MKENRSGRGAKVRDVTIHEHVPVYLNNNNNKCCVVHYMVQVMHYLTQNISMTMQNII